MKKSITIFVPAYNEEKNLASAVKRYNKIVKTITTDYEIIIIDDASTDATGKIADNLAKIYKNVRVVHNKKNMNLGYGFKRAAQLARKNYFICLTGEGETKDKSIKELLGHVGKADLVIAYIGNPEVRTLFRRLLSRLFTIKLNLLFGLHLKYYNGQSLYKVKDLRKVKMTTNSFAYQAEILVRLLKSNKKYSIIQVPYLRTETTGSTLFRVKNLVGVFKTVIKLLWDVYIKRDI